MSLSVYQGLQSCLEPKLVEPRVLRIKLTPPPPPPSPRSNSSPSKECANNSGKENLQNNEKNKGGWSFIQSMNGSATDDNNKVYVHPLDKSSSSSKLSNESLEMCTESLGSETGSDNGSDYDTNCEMTRARTKTFQKNKKIIMSRVKSQSQTHSFPPPLTSISGSTGVQMRPRREGGRLVLEAVKISTTTTCFHAERSEGRLRISLLKEYCSPPIEIESDLEEKEDRVDEGKDGINENLVDVRPTRCNEGNGGHGNRKTLLAWEPFLVAT
ncbi:hypothetical protein ACFE04_015064 [Oxalis oulophora]